ncbi:protein-P-II uridylyltransferase [Deferribacter desulfuricans SSM1]|uniref:Bifunctional uridylyltransferase/uridylyl-removing enzyme n=1 Tax=Deferribacter desulfuricans (strain DSM 14783 / JCM 11476 / NBRC 101012 / SSM1) TaxID=639282 RepID=D3P9C2_DEFDS|nr:[protein-PII] uridylyltransferase [Deferribacter desulfuricans]BAI81312.1 protein-P-II uridylyltransferase [Deferribacter desulfuricans SSM1]
MIKDELKNFYWNRWNDIKESRKKYPTSWQLLFKISELSYDTIKYALKLTDFPLDNITFISLGSFAREQMSPFSDIDILLLHKDSLKSKEKDAISKFSTLLWDININPAIQIKSFKEIKQTNKLDTTEKTALIDYKFIEGNNLLFEEYVKTVNSYIIEKGKMKFLLEHINAAMKRGEKYRDSVYKLEPNLKEGHGGIRDFNFICWINRILFNGASLNTLIKKDIITIEDYDLLMKGVEFIFKVRNELHYYFNRKFDILTIEAQKDIASELGYITTSMSLNVEHFLRDYYGHARNISQITKKVINKGLQEIVYNKTHKKATIRKLGYGLIQYNNNLTAEHPDIFEKNHELLINVFYIAAVRSLKLSDKLINIIRNNLYLIDENYLKKYGKLFLKVISSFPYSYKITKNMLNTGVLESIIPEFKEIICRVQYDLYHHYTVDEHTILALKFIDDLITNANPRNKNYIDAYKRLKRKDLLALSILLHDIGKGQGFNHSVVGAKMSQTICKRLGMHPDDIDTVSNMVEQHLLMSHIAQRRDLHDIEVIEYFTNYLNNEDELHLLYLLTYADMNAVGGDLFNEWKSSLLTELYLKSKAALEKESIISEYNKIVELKRKKLFERISDDIIKGFIDKLDSEYIFTYKVKHIIRHLNMIKKLNPDVKVLTDFYVRDDLNCLEFNICTYDFLGLLKKLSGVFAYYGLNILGAQIFTFDNNIVIDTIQVVSSSDSTNNLLKKGDKIAVTIKEVVTNKTSVEDLIKRASTPFFKKKIPKEIKKKVEFDNEISSNYTVIDVFTEDKIGLLYKILSVFEDLGINVQKAKISTDVDRVVDSFYVTDKNYHKITEQTFIDKIKFSLMEVI